MGARAAGWTFVVAVLVAGACVPGAVAGNAATAYNLGDWDHKFVGYLKSHSAASGPYLSADKDAASADAYQAADATSGVMLQPTAIQGGRSAPAEFKLEAPLSSPYWLNLSKPIVGAIWFQSLLTSNAGHEDTAVVVEVFVGDVRIGGDMLPYFPATASQAWTPFFFKFRPEVDRLLPGQTLTVKVSRMTGYADFSIGTSGTHQSFVEFRYFDANPLHGAFYLEGQRLVPLGDQPPTEAQFDAAHDYLSHGGIHATQPGLVHVPQAEAPAASGTHIVAVLLLAPLGLLGRARGPRRRATMLAVALLLTGGLAGCMGGGGHTATAQGTGSDAPKPVANETIQVEPELMREGHGALQGIVLDGDNQNLPIRAAHVAIIGTDLFGGTDSKGGFVFENVSAGSYLVRVDADAFQTFEHSVTIENGKRTLLNVTLYRPQAGSLNTRAHTHDLWGDATSKLIVDKDVLLHQYLYDLAPSSANVWWQPTFAAAEGVVALDPGTLVLPGTSAADVTLTWSGSAMPKELGLRITTSGNKTTDQIFLPRASGVPFHIPLFPNEADGGHQDATDWVFFVRLPGSGSADMVWGPGVFAGGQVHIKVTILKGIVPYEPPHRTFWNGADRLEMFHGQKLSYGTVCCVPPYYPGVIAAVPPKGKFVPPGTNLIQGHLAWSTQGLPVDQTWHLLYHASDQAASDPNWKAATMKSSGATSADFTIAVTPTMVDQFYQSTSRWRFTVDNDVPDAVHNVLVVNEGAQTTWTLDLTVLKDPAYTESSA